MGKKYIKNYAFALDTSYAYVRLRLSVRSVAQNPKCKGRNE